VQQSDAKTDDTTLDGGVDVHDVSVKPGATDDDKLWLITVDLKGEHKRFMQLQATAADGTTGVNLAALALFENPGVPEAKAGAAVHESV
jgi:hypothetical protein